MISKDVSQLKEDFALNQLEEDLGGTRPLDTKFFPFPLPPGALGSNLLVWTLYIGELYIDIIDEF